MLRSKKFNTETGLIIVCCIVIFYTLYLLKNATGGRLDFGPRKPSPLLVSVYQAQASQRRSFLQHVKNVDEAEGYGIIYNVLGPEAYCPEIMKVGTTEDGGKWMCSPANLPDDCVIFALGIAGVITYERDIQKYSEQRCRIISVDSGKQKDSVIQELRDIRGVVVQAMIGPENNSTTRTMSNILEEHGVREVEIMKMDIEGAEFSTMKDFLNSYTPAQIMIEIHGTPKETVELLNLFGSKGYLLFHYEINGRHANLCEYAFIHESRLEQYGATYLARFL